MIDDTEFPWAIVFACTVLAILLCAPLLIISAVRTRRSPASLPAEYILLPPIRRDGA